VTGFLGFISSSGKHKLTDANIRKCVLQQHAGEMLKYRANNTAEALINLLQVILVIIRCLFFVVFIDSGMFIYL
jgi:hypothetical protein